MAPTPGGRTRTACGPLHRGQRRVPTAIYTGVNPQCQWPGHGTTTRSPGEASGRPRHSRAAAGISGEQIPRPYVWREGEAARMMWRRHGPGTGHPAYRVDGFVHLGIPRPCVRGAGRTGRIGKCRFFFRSTEACLVCSPVPAPSEPYMTGTFKDHVVPEGDRPGDGLCGNSMPRTYEGPTRAGILVGWMAEGTHPRATAAAVAALIAASGSFAAAPTAAGADRSGASVPAGRHFRGGGVNLDRRTRSVRSELTGPSSKIHARVIPRRPSRERAAAPVGRRARRNRPLS